MHFPTKYISIFRTLWLTETLFIGSQITEVLILNLLRELLSHEVGYPDHFQVCWAPGIIILYYIIILYPYPLQDPSIFK